MTSLRDLVNGLPESLVIESPDFEITGISLDSRSIEKGNLFVALSGGKTDGHRYIGEAIRRGALAVVGSEESVGLPVPYIRVADTRLALAQLSAAFYQYPARNLVVIGVTGTDGKTTTASLIHHILQDAGFRTGLISTVNALIGETEIDTGFHVTTPEAPDIQRYLSLMVDSGLTHVVLEATSHGLAQHRVTGCEFDIGVLTNVTHEHLDYHGSFEAYQKAKGTLFTSLEMTPEKPFGVQRGAVLNRDDHSYPFFKELTRLPQITYGINEESDICAKRIKSSAEGTEFEAIGKIFGGKPIEIRIKSHLLGSFNIANCLAAISATAGFLNVGPPAVQKGIAKLSGVPGRMEQVRLRKTDGVRQDFQAVVDFAHTPNALKQALTTCRSLTNGRVIAVFGSAGLRDREKRRLMAEVSAELADLTVLTVEDPRTESLDVILSEMAAGMQAKSGQEGKTFWRIPDRREAIRFAIRIAHAGDLVVACGKGHEQSMCFGEQEFPWDDRAAMRAALAERFGVPGYEMPYLPT